MNNEQKLGIKVFYFYLYKRVLAGLILLILSTFVASARSPMISKLVFIFPTNVAVAIAQYLINGLFIISILFLVGGSFLSWLDYVSCTFSMDENAFRIRRGIFGKKEVSIPYRQIQDISIEQTFSYKMMGVSKLVILTAGNDSSDKEGEAEGIFEVIDAKLASKTREDLLSRANIQNVKEVKNI